MKFILENKYKIFEYLQRFNSIDIDLFVIAIQFDTKIMSKKMICHSDIMQVTY